MKHPGAYRLVLDGCSQTEPPWKNEKKPAADQASLTRRNHEAGTTRKVSSINFSVLYHELLKECKPYFHVEISKVSAAYLLFLSPPDKCLPRNVNCFPRKYVIV